MQTKQISLSRTCWESVAYLYDLGYIKKDELEKIQARIIKPAINKMKKSKGEAWKSI